MIEQNLLEHYIEHIGFRVLGKEGFYVFEKMEGDQLLLRHLRTNETHLIHWDEAESIDSSIPNVVIDKNEPIQNDCFRIKYLASLVSAPIGGYISENVFFDNAWVEPQGCIKGHVLIKDSIIRDNAQISVKGVGPIFIRACDLAGKGFIDISVKRPNLVFSRLAIRDFSGIFGDAENDIARITLKGMEQRNITLLNWLYRMSKSL